MRCTPILLLLLLLTGPAAAGDSVTIAVASNFSRTASELSSQFSANTGVDVRISNGSTGKLFAQIVNGAPFDVFLAADTNRPKLLEELGHAVPGSRFTYATGALVIWSRDAQDCLAVLHDPNAGHIALANPLTAPYGRAAKEFLVNEGLWEATEKRAVYGENIMQALQFAATGNAVLGLIARSQLANPILPDTGCAVQVSASSHEPLHQQAVLISEDNNAAKLYLDFLKSDAARKLIREHGYEVAE